MQKGEILENIKIEKLIFGGNGLALALDGKKIIISGGAIPGSFVNVKILKSKKNYYEGQLLETVKKSLLEQELPAHFQVYGGCKWLPIAYENQTKIKEEQVREAFNHLKEFIVDTNFHPIVESPEIYGYRNKVEFSWGKYISEREGIHDEYRFGFHKQGMFDRIIDCSFCVLADDEINEIFKKVDEFARNSGLPTYDPKRQEGFWRHFVVRKAQFTEEIMLIFSINSNYSGYTRKQEGDIKVFINMFAKDFSNIKSIYLLYNIGKADIVTGEFELIFGEKTIKENLLGKTFEINPKSFFQTNSLGAEKLYGEVVKLISDFSLTPNPSPRVERGAKDILEYPETPGYVYELAKKFRKDGTNSEEIIWELLRDRKIGNLKFRRQHPIGRYIADFYCAEIGLIIELDGKVHENISQKEYDNIRDEYLKNGNYKILRIKNEDINNLNEIINKIISYQNISPLHSDGEGSGVRVLDGEDTSIMRTLEGDLKSNGILLDLYAGTGTIGIILSEFFKKVYSVELVKESSEDGKHNAILNNCNNIEFVNAKVEKFLEEFVKTGEKPEVLVIDPPREGMHPDALPNIISFNSKTIIYVSCNPSTLARDLDYVLKNSTYKVTDVIPVDMFPHTHHIETIVKLVK